MSVRRARVRTRESADAKQMEVEHDKPILIRPRRVVAVDAMDDAFASHGALRHPALYSYKLSGRRRKLTRELHLEDHRTSKHAHVHTSAQLQRTRHALPPTRTGVGI
jgi:hypothetical protein